MFKEFYFLIFELAFQKRYFPKRNNTNPNFYCKIVNSTKTDFFDKKAFLRFLY